METLIFFFGKKDKSYFNKKDEDNNYLDRRSKMEWWKDHDNNYSATIYFDNQFTVNINNIKMTSPNQAEYPYNSNEVRCGDLGINTFVPLFFVMQKK